MTSPNAVGRSTLVAPRLKVLYTPTTKVACTTIKWMLAEAEGSLNLDVIPRLLAANLHRSQTIHNRHVSGLQKLNELPEHQIEEILSSSDWVRLAALRDPIARSYSSWENRIFMRAPGR
ncbi:MAG: Sulfotransferase family, partial [Actinomycetota bacterium]